MDLLVVIGHLRREDGPEVHEELPVELHHHGPGQRDLQSQGDCPLDPIKRPGDPAVRFLQVPPTILIGIQSLKVRAALKSCFVSLMISLGLSRIAGMVMLTERTTMDCMGLRDVHAGGYRPPARHF
jgi:hypothetical protein